MMRHYLSDLGKWSTSLAVCFLVWLFGVQFFADRLLQANSQFGAWLLDSYNELIGGQLFFGSISTYEGFLDLVFLLSCIVTVPLALLTNVLIWKLMADFSAKE